MIKHSHHHDDVLPAAKAPSIAFVADEQGAAWLIISKANISIPELIKGRVKKTIKEYPSHYLRAIKLAPIVELWHFVDEAALVDIKYVEDHRNQMRRINVHRTFGVGFSPMFWFRHTSSSNSYVTRRAP